METLRIYIIGNGFDLAHGLKTDYNSFFNWYLNQCMDSAKKELFDLKSDADAINSVMQYQDDLIRFSIKPSNDRNDIINNFKSTKSLYEKNHHVNITTNFLKSIFENNPPPSWGNIEYLYYLALEKIYINYKSGHYKSTPDSENIYLRGINTEFDFLTIKLNEYLSQQIDQNVSVDGFKKIFRLENDSKINNLILNFNYTSTFKQYLNLKDKTINIHGSLGDKENPIIFGLGDEYSDIYKKMEDRNEDEYLKNVKSIKYLLSNQYSELQKQVAISNEIEIYIIGHSCSISDRTLLKELFNNDKCKWIDIYNHNGKKSYTNSLYGISRYFDNNQIMRSKVLDYNDSLKIPQI